MDKARIINALERGEYTITHDEGCLCNIDWAVLGGELVCDVDGHECWESNGLYVDCGDGWGDVLIAEYVRYDRLHIYDDDITADDIPDAILDEMGIPEVCEQGESGSPECHDANVREELIRYLMEGKYLLDRDDCRGFANEYTMILREPADGETAIITREDAEEWADDYLYAGDAATAAYVSCLVVAAAQ